MTTRSLTLLTAACFVVTLTVTLGAQARGGRAGTPAAAASRVPTGPVTGSAVRGKKTYYDYSCYACHGVNGETGARTFVPNWPANLATESTFTAFLRGRANLAPEEPSAAMPNYDAKTLSDAQAKDIYAYIRTFRFTTPPVDQIPTMNAILQQAQKPYRP